MPDTKHCVECAAPLPTYWPKGLCARCALDGALEMSNAASQFLPPKALAVTQEDVKPPVSGAEASLPESFGDYDLLEEIARGGMGVVYKARQRNLGRIVAVKLILAGPLAGKDFVRRFRTESATAAILQHPNIVGIHDVGVHEGRHFFSMDYVEGQNLAQLVGQRPLPAAKAARYVSLIATAIHYAHEHGILHRDLKPSNVLIDQDDQPRITDFGLAKRLDSESTLTVTGQVLGSPNFMPPEQAGGRSRKVGRPSDVYALGGILYYLLTARAPFQADSLEHLITQVLSAEPVSPRLLNPSIHKDLEIITLKCLEKEPAHRYQTAQELAEELNRFLRQEPIRARAITVPGKLWRWSCRKPVLALLIVLLHVVAGLGLAGILWQWRRAEQHAKSERQQRERFEAGESNAVRQLYIANMNQAQQAWKENDASRVRLLLEETAQAPGRGFEWNYWQRQTHLELQTLRGHSGPILAVAYSPDGRRIVTSSADTTAKVWDSATGKEAYTLRGHSGAVRAAAFSSDSRRIVTGSSDGKIKIWSTDSGTNLLTFKGQSDRIFSVTFSPDGQLLATGGEDPKVRIWDAATGRLIRTLTGHTARVLAVAFSPDGARIVTSSWDKSAKVFDVANGKDLLTLKSHDNAVSSVAFSPDGERIVTGSWDHLAKVWDAADGHELFSLRGHTGPVVSATFSPDGQRIVSAGDDQTARVWDVRNHDEPLAIKMHGSPISSVAFSADGQRFVTAAGASWGFSPLGQEIDSGSGDYTAKVWETSGNREVLVLKGHTERVMSVAISRDGQRIVTGSFDQTAIVWDAVSGRELHPLKGHTGAIRSVAISPDGQQIATGSWDETVKIWEANSGKLLQTLDQHRILFMSVAFSPDSKRVVACGQDKLATVWDTTTGAEELTIQGEPISIWSASYSPDGKWIVTANEDPNSTAKIWDAATGRNLLTLKGHSSWLMSATFSPDGHRILTAGGHDLTARVWDAATGTNQLTLKGHSGWVISAGFSPDSQRIVTGSQDGTAKVWDASSGKELLTLKGHRGWIFSAVFAPDGRRIVTGSGDGTARVWEAASAQQIANWQKEEQAVVEHAEAKRREESRNRTLRAQDPGISEWMVLAPVAFDGTDGAAALDQEQLPQEAAIHPRVGEPVKFGIGERIWTAVQPKDHWIDFNNFVGKETRFSVAYAVCYILSDTEHRDLVLKVGSDDQAKIFLNEREVYRQTVPRSGEPDKDQVPGVELKAGVNVLVFKVLNEEGDWGGSVRFTDAAGQPIKGLRVTLTPPQ